MSTYNPVPDLTAGRELKGQEKDFAVWINANCEWKDGEKADLKTIVEAYQRSQKAKNGVGDAPRTIVPLLPALGFIVAEPWVVGLFLRDKDATVPVTPPDRTNHGIANVNMADLIQANNPITPKPKEIVKRPIFEADANGIPRIIGYREEEVDPDPEVAPGVRLSDLKRR